MTEGAGVKEKYRLHTTLIDMQIHLDNQSVLCNTQLFKNNFIYDKNQIKTKFCDPFAIFADTTCSIEQTPNMCGYTRCHSATS